MQDRECKSAGHYAEVAKLTNRMSARRIHDHWGSTQRRGTADSMKPQVRLTFRARPLPDGRCRQARFQASHVADGPSRLLVGRGSISLGCGPGPAMRSATRAWVLLGQGSWTAAGRRHVRFVLAARLGSRLPQIPRSRPVMGPGPGRESRKLRSPTRRTHTGPTKQFRCDYPARARESGVLDPPA